MIRFIFLLFSHFIFVGFILAQSNDSLAKPGDSALPIKIIRTRHDTSKIRSTAHINVLSQKTESLLKDSLLKQSLKDTTWMTIGEKYRNRNFIQVAFNENVFFAFRSPAISVLSDKIMFKGKEILFYTLMAMLLFFAFIRSSFPKYLTDVFRVAFRTTIKQRQIGEQLIQTPVPSLLLNIFFLLSASFYITFVVQHFHLATDYSFWVLYSYSFVALAIIYLLKFLSLKFSGWLFNISPTTDGYIFIVFLINKIIGIFLLPFLVLLAFTDNDIYLVAFVLSYMGVFALLAYRFILSYGLIRNQIRVSPFHFLIYLLAFEIVPLFLIYKALLLWFSK
ncbi:MAG TPA: DUF4271 domain-containing protein [Chitinophagaceae bacterium]